MPSDKFLEPLEQTPRKKNEPTRKHTTVIGPPTYRANDEQFRSRIHDLPPEIYAIIRAYTFTIPTETLIIVNKRYKPPAVLQVSRAIRDRLLFQYYLYNRFWILINPASKQMLAWFSSVPAGPYRSMVDLKVPIWKDERRPRTPRTFVELMIYVHSRRSRSREVLGS